MGNDNKVDIVRRSKEIFLPDELRPDETVQVYSLADEFEKTRKNRSFLFLFTVIGFALFIIIGSILITQYIRTQQRQIDIGISDFQDIKLREILDSSNKYQGELNTARDDLDNIRLEQQKQILNVRDSAARDREKVLALHLAGPETDRRLKEIKDREDAQIRNVNAQYQRKLDAKETEIAGLKTKVDAYDRSMKSGVQKAESILNNYEQLHKIKMDRQKEYYDTEMANQKRYYEDFIKSLILKYNPVFTGPQLKLVLSSPTRAEFASTPSLKDYQAELRRENIMSQDRFTGLRTSIANNSLVMERMQRIPYENSPPAALIQMAQLTNRIIYDYESLWYNLVEVLRQKNVIISNYRYAFDYYAKLNPESGFVIDPREPQNVRVHMSTPLSVKTGDIGLIFRKDDEYIGKIQFTKRPYAITGKVIEVVTNKRILPFDKILLKISKDHKE